MSKGQIMWEKAKSLIPNGNSLLSKNPDMFLPNFWPAYFSKAKGCYVWDLEGRKYIDMSIMGIGTNILGYGNEEIDETVKKVIQNGNMSTLNCIEEVDLAEKLINIHSWAHKVKFARTGGEANAISIRIGRAYSGKDKVAFCGYHGWHDWYLAANLPNEKNLDKHLLPGLETKGVPKNLKNTIFPFSFNNFEELENIVKNNEIGVIKMEVFRNEPPKNNFLKQVRNLANSKNIILIFDECTSGFRETNGGLHLNFDVNPDLLILGKALGNGYAINAILGKDEIMNEAENSFISSTFWTERIGPSAAIKTLELMKNTKSWEIITQKGNYLRKKWKELAIKLDIDLSINGLPALSSFTFNSKDHLAYKTLITQEMLKKNILASNVVYLSTTHSKELMDEYLDELEKVFVLIRECEEGRSVSSLLNGPICRSGFKRLN